MIVCWWNYSNTRKWIWEYGEESDEFNIELSDEVRLLFLLSQLYAWTMKMKQNFGYQHCRSDSKFKVWVTQQFQLSKQKNQSHLPQWWSM